MNIESLLEESKQKQRELVDKINQLKQQEQVLLQEAIRMEGEIRILQKLMEQKKDKGD